MGEGLLCVKLGRLLCEVLVLKLIILETWKIRRDVLWTLHLERNKVLVDDFSR